MCRAREGGGSDDETHSIGKLSRKRGSLSAITGLRVGGANDGSVLSTEQFSLCPLRAGYFWR
jgi:hypothetical protein